MEIDSVLRDICNTPTGPYLRPFLPNPNWQAAVAFVVGTNPATPLRDEFPSFDAYWRGLTRSPELFQQTYLRARQGSPSKTSRRVADLCRYLNDINYLVTNAAAYPAKKETDVPREQWVIGEKIFRMLFEQCRPKVVFLHGRRARNLIENVFKVTLDPFADPFAQSQQERGCLFLCAPHLSGAGMPAGAKFSCDTALPLFAKRIRNALA